MLRNNLITAAAVFTLASSASADISFSLSADLLKDQNGAAFPTTGLFLLVASTSDSNFSIANTIASGASTSLGSFLSGDDMIIARGDLSVNNIPGVLEATLVVNPTSPVFGGLFGQNDRLALLWFPGLTLGSTSIPTGSRFGFYDGGVATAPNVTDADFSGRDGSSSWITPSNPNSGYTLAFLTKDGEILGSPDASNSSAAGIASGLVVVPEPATAVSSAFGLSLLVSRRRRV